MPYTRVPNSLGALSDSGTLLARCRRYFPAVGLTFFLLSVIILSCCSLQMAWVMDLAQRSRERSNEMYMKMSQINPSSLFSPLTSSYSSDGDSDDSLPTNADPTHALQLLRRFHHHERSIDLLNATLRYKDSLIRHYRDLMVKHCEFLLGNYGLTPEHIRGSKLISKLIDPRNRDVPPMKWSKAERQSWVELGCMNTILRKRAEEELETNYQELVERARKSLERRQKLVAEKYGMERGKYSLRFRHEGECGSTLRCVISMSLYGSSPRYTHAIQNSVRRMPKVFPGWELRVYYDHTVPPAILSKLLNWERESQESVAPGMAKLQLINVTAPLASGGIWPYGSGESRRISGLFYRFLAADDPTIDRWISRDCDALLMDRDAAAVQEWMDSGWTFHTMADFPQHGRMLGGMWGSVNYYRPDNGHTMMMDLFDGLSMQKLIEAYTLNLTIKYPDQDPKHYNVDQEFQLTVLWPHVKDDYLGHDSYHCIESRNSISFPLQRPEPYMFIGQTQAVSEDGLAESDTEERTEPKYEIIPKRPAPPECRRKPEWIYG